MKQHGPKSDVHPCQILHTALLFIMYVNDALVVVCCCDRVQVVVAMLQQEIMSSIERAFVGLQHYQAVEEHCCNGHATARAVGPTLPRQDGFVAGQPRRCTTEHPFQMYCCKVTTK